MDQASKNYIPPMKMASAGGIILNMSTVKSISIAWIEVNGRGGLILVSYINGTSEQLRVNTNPEYVVAELFEGIR